MKQAMCPGAALLRRSPVLRALIKEQGASPQAIAISRFATLLLEHVAAASTATEDDLLSGGLEASQARLRELASLAETIGLVTAQDILGEQERRHRWFHYQSVREALEALKI